jgi:muramoyltetrapeptide carboxypeptidase
MGYKTIHNYTHLSQSHYWGSWKSKNGFFWEPRYEIPTPWTVLNRFRRISRWKFINTIQFVRFYSAIDCTKILFIEDLDEYLYHIDRMMMNLKRNGCLKV